jgi:hydrogenase expression/formation protein HypD
MDLSRDFRRPDLAKAILSGLKSRLAGRGRPLRLMEVCGTHTVAISRSGLRTLLAPEVDLVSGPGCPVCVTPQGEIDLLIELALRPDVTVVTFGDMMRVPGSRMSLAEARAAGARVQIVYSAFDGVREAAASPERKVVFLGVGFETTAPGTALAIEAAAASKVANFLVYPAHKLVPPALEALLAGAEEGSDLDGFILPGHVSAVIGRRAYACLERLGIPAAVAGFEPVDILLAVERVAAMVESGRAAVENAYPRAVTDEGNLRAQAAIARCFEPAGASWRGLGPIPASGLAVREAFAAHDATRALGVRAADVPEPEGCSCGEVLRGRLKPTACPLFDRRCRPERPVGPCMVSTEGACAAYHQYERGGGLPG